MDRGTRAFADELTKTASSSLMKMSKEITQGSTLGNPREARRSVYKRLLGWLNSLGHREKRRRR